MRGLSAIVLASLLAGCGGAARAPRPAEVYDLGTEPPPRLETGMLSTVQVAAPSWLRTSAMQYRLSYASASQRHAYLESRWAAPPAELLLSLLNRSLGGGGACRLEVELDEFVQDYSSAGQSEGVIDVHARLRGDGVLLASRGFTLKLPAPSPDAPGGVAALGRGSRELATELGGWLAEQGRDAKIRDACARR